MPHIPHCGACSAKLHIILCHFSHLHLLSKKIVSHLFLHGLTYMIYHNNHKTC